MNSRKQNSFFPYIVFEISLVALFVVEAVLLLAAVFPQAVGREIDVSAQYQPRPEWYFLFLYQLTKYFPGHWTFVGAVLLPVLAYSVFLLAPFLDPGGGVSLHNRKGAAITGGLFLVAAIVLTVLALL